jgi:SAM-dependent methyltransferase
MLDLITGYWVSRAIHAVTRAGIPDRLGASEKTAEELAHACGVNASALHRVMRALTSKGVFAERPGARFALTPLGATLRSGGPGSMKSFALMMVDDYNWQAWQELSYSLVTGANAFERVHGKPAFAYLAEHPQQAKVFGDSMSDLSAVETPAVVETYDFSHFAKIVDVGGGHGVLLTTILRANPRLSGVLYDSSHVIENARKDAPVNAPDLAGRLELVAGDFFEEVPAGADACIMKYILHDWDDERAGRILTNCRRALRPAGTLLAVDTVVRSGEENAWSKWLDINMLVLVGGKERTEEEFRELYRRAGFRLTRVVPTRCPLSIVEGVAV